MLHRFSTVSAAFAANHANSPRFAFEEFATLCGKAFATLCGLYPPRRTSKHSIQTFHRNIPSEHFGECSYRIPEAAWLIGSPLMR